MYRNPIPKSISRAAFIVAAILVGFFVPSALYLLISSDNWLLILLAAFLVLCIAIPFFDKAFGDKIPFRIRRFFSSSLPKTNLPQRRKQERNSSSTH